MIDIPTKCKERYDRVCEYAGVKHGDNGFDLGARLRKNYGKSFECQIDKCIKDEEEEE